MGVADTDAEVKKIIAANEEETSGKKMSIFSAIAIKPFYGWRLW
jgi:hypothetical protein